MYKFILCLSISIVLPSPAAEKPISYNRDIQPILAEACFNCHGQDANSRKGKLRLDILEGALKGGKSDGPGITPGQPDKSSIIARILTDDEDDLMPPEDSGKTLTKEQKDLLKAWVKQGAKYEKHWAYIKPKRPNVENKNAPIDSLVEKVLKSKNLALSPQAKPNKLIRRLYLDLIGIPPSPEEIDEFTAKWNSNKKKAYSDLVDKLLASPKFGEKWARHWLDAARYADSDGYEKDLPRNQWPWRDWVINAINKDMPYNQFIIEQIAGDLLPNATQEQKVATGFLRNSMVNEEGAIIAEEFRIEGMFDRMDCVGKAVLGMTLQCAQCHTHKFDPLTHTEYFGLFSFINNTYDSFLKVYSPEQQKQIAQIKKKTENLNNELMKKIPDVMKLIDKWEQDLKAKSVKWTSINPTSNIWVGGLAHPQKMEDNSILTLGFRPNRGEMIIEGQIDTKGSPKGLLMEALTHGDLPFGGPGRSDEGTFAIAELKIEIRKDSSQKWQHVKLVNASADFSEKSQPLRRPYANDKEKRTVGPASFLIDGNEDTAWGSDRGPGRRNNDIRWMAHFDPAFKWPADKAEIKITMIYRHGGKDGHGRDNQFLGRVRFSTTDSPSPTADGLYSDAREALNIDKKKRTLEQSKALNSSWIQSYRGAENVNKVLDQYNGLIDKEWAKYPNAVKMLTLEERENAYTRTTSLLDRGVWNKPKKVVPSGVPDFLHPLPENSKLDRLTFAKWLVDKNSPTTARVFVNRAWQTMFGLGLVETPEDFGVRAPLPTHPDLLDWLAVEFMNPANGKDWSVKTLLKTIVMSRTYQQDSKTTPKLLEIDPKNKLLARGPRFRVESEVVRDIALSVSGLLHDKVGGASFFPPIPKSVLDYNFVKIPWPFAGVPERYRRSLYMFRRRSMPDPVMAGFDAPNGDSSCVRRVTSNTPLAALTSLNEPVFVEAARAMALKVIRKGGSDDLNRINYAFRLCTGRVPNTLEVNEIKRLLDSRKAYLAESWVSVQELAFGENGKVPDLPEGVTPKDVGAWTIVSRVLLNLDQTITKD